MIGDWVLVDGTPRKVEAITKKKIGYHLDILPPLKRVGFLDTSV